MNTNADEYTAESIQVLTGIDAVRKRPGMYFGGTDRDALHHLALEVIDHMLVDHIDRFANHIAIRVDDERITIEHDGRGIPIDPCDDTAPERLRGIPILEVVFTQLGACWPKHLACGGMHGVGIAAVNAVCSELEVDVWRQGHAHAQRYARGKAQGPIEYRSTTTRTGTRISFVPDFDIFERNSWDVPRIAARCRDLAALYPGITMTVDDDSYRYDDGIADRVRELSGWLDPFHVRATHDGIAVDIALAWSSSPSIQTFANLWPTTSGSHIAALYNALTTVIAKRLPTQPISEELRRGLVAIMHVEIEHPRYKTQTKDHLYNPEAGEAVRAILLRELPRYFDETPAVLDALLMQLDRSAPSPKRSARARSRTPRARD